jgi:hypothetical protein
MKKFGFQSEEALAEMVVKWLKNNGWTVYQEVQLNRYGSTIADIVAEKAGIYWIIECKLNFSFSVMSQADRWKNFANFVSIACPYTKVWPFKEKLCKLLDIGVITVAYERSYSCYSTNIVDKHGIIERVPKIEQILLHKSLINCLTEKHKTFAKAGNNYGARLTPFKLTVENLIAYVKQNNGCLLKEAIKNIKHHYSTNNSAKGCLSRLINSDVIKELYIERAKEGNRVYLK